jgi:hypothetical protein
MRCPRPSGTRDRTPDPWPQTPPSLGEPPSSQIISIFLLIRKTNKKPTFWGAFFARKIKYSKDPEEKQLFRK